MKYQIMSRDYSNFHEDMRIWHMEHDFFMTRMIERVFNILDFAGISIPSELIPYNRYYLFNDRTTDTDYFIDTFLGSNNELFCQFVLKDYTTITFVSYSIPFIIIKEYGP